MFDSEIKYINRKLWKHVNLQKMKITTQVVILKRDLSQKMNLDLVNPDLHRENLETLTRNVKCQDHLLSTQEEEKKNLQLYMLEGYNLIFKKNT